MRSTRVRRDRRTPRRAEVLALLDGGASYDEVGERLGVHPGLAYLIATGLPADGSDAPSADARERPGVLSTSQHLSNPAPVHNPTAKSSVHDWVRRRAAADEQMQRAAAARTPGPAPRQDGDEEADLVDLLTRDHNQVTDLLKQLATIPGARKGGSEARMSARKSIVDMVTVALRAHVAAEHEHLWPAVRASLDDGAELGDQAREMDAHADDVLGRLEELSGTEDEFDDLVEELSLAARKHVAFEAPVFVRLRDRRSHEDLVDLGRGAREDEGTAG